MQAKITLTKPGESWGAPGARSHQQDSELVAELRAGWVEFSVKAGALNSHELARCRGESVAAISLTMDHVRTLAAFLSTLPTEE